MGQRAAKPKRAPVAEQKEQQQQEAPAKPKERVGCWSACFWTLVAVCKAFGIVGGATAVLVLVVPRQLYYLLFVTFPLACLRLFSDWAIGFLIALVSYLYVCQREALAATWITLKRRFRGEQIIEADHAYLNEAEDLAADNAVLRFLARKHDVDEEDVQAYLRNGEDFYHADKKLHAALCGCDCSHYDGSRE